MCGRYYINDDLAKEINQLVRDIDRKMRLEKLTGDVRPSEESLVLLHNEATWEPAVMRWGFRGRDGKGLLINARAETVQEKPTFQASVRQRRCIIPASGFYEWNSRREKYRFYRPQHPVMYFAGCWREDEDGRHFVILTTEANASMRPVHGRMPLLLAEPELESWMRQPERLDALLAGQPEELEKKTGYEQMTLELF